MKKLLSLIFCATLLSAQNIDLAKIISQVRLHHPNYKALEAESLALNAKILADYAHPASEISFDTTNADPDADKSQVEYSLGASTLIDLANTRGLELESADLQNEAALLYKQKELFRFSNEIRKLYHRGCLNKESVKILQTTLDAFNKLYRKKEKAYKFQEISKKELLQLQLEQKLLRQKVTSHKKEYEISKEALLNLISIAHTSDTDFECNDLAPVVSDISIDNSPFILSNLAFEKEMQSLEKQNDRYSKILEPVELSVHYDDEIDTKKTGIGFSIPLSFTSAKNEQSRIYILHKKEMKRLRHNGWLLEQTALKKQLEAEIKGDFTKINALKENIDTYENTLMPLIEKSFQMGESSVIEYLMGRQKLLEISLELIETKKNYYEKLFNLYTLIETEK